MLHVVHGLAKVDVILGNLPANTPLSWSRYSWKLHHHVDRHYNVFVPPILERASKVLYEEFVCLAMSFFGFASRV